MVSLVSIELLDRWDSIPVGEWVPLRFVVTRPADQTGAVTLPAGGVRCQFAKLNLDLFSQDITLQPGESVALVASLRCDTPGTFETANVSLQVNPTGGDAKDRQLLPLPAHSFRVVPSLAQLVSITLHRVCSYDDAVKLEVVVANTSDATDLIDLELELEPRSAVRAGPLRRCEARLAARTQLKFDLVVVGNCVEFAMSAVVGGQRVEDRYTRSVPTSEQASEQSTRKEFEFLEPRALTIDRIQLTAEERSDILTARDGIYRVRGGQARYVLTVSPSHPTASKVRLYPARGQVEVEPLERRDRDWPFLLTVVDNPMFTQLVRLDYDVQVSGTPLRGELYLSIQPTNWKLWGIAITAGLALTAKGIAALGPALVHPDGSAEGVFEYMTGLFEKRWFDALQATSIFLIRGVLALANYCMEIFTE